MKRLDYDNLPLLPGFIADIVARRPYTNSEMSEPHAVFAAEIEKKRLEMNEIDIFEFADACDARCRAAYLKRAPWFEKIVNATGNSGRDQLYVFIAHWLASFLSNRQGFLRRWAIRAP